MAQDNQISVVLTPEIMTEIMQAIETLKKHLSFLVNLTAEERIAYSKMGDKTVAFVQKSLDYAQENPQLIPPYLNVSEFDKDMELIRQLKRVLRPLTSLNEAVDDTIMLAGHESYAAALTFYQSVKMAKAMNVAGTTTIYDDLKLRFPGRGAAASSSTTTEETKKNIDSDS
ncbi:MAG: hypothetical protein ACPG5B_17355 [Chitinophagales bacterium]